MEVKLHRSLGELKRLERVEKGGHCQPFTGCSIVWAKVTCAHGLAIASPTPPHSTPTARSWFLTTSRWSNFRRTARNLTRLRTSGITKEPLLEQSRLW